MCIYNTLTVNATHVYMTQILSMQHVALTVCRVIYTHVYLWHNPIRLTGGLLCFNGMRKCWIECQTPILSAHVYRQCNTLINNPIRILLIPHMAAPINITNALSFQHPRNMWTPTEQTTNDSGSAAVVVPLTKKRGATYTQRTFSWEFQFPDSQ